VLRDAWPNYVCKEMGGAAWQGTVVTKVKGGAIVRFTKARTRDGRRYENARIPLDKLRHLA
jgi:hypothetical protein